MSLKIVNGKIVEETGARSFVEFYEHAKKVGVGKFDTVIYITIKPVGCKDFMSRPATDADKAEYPVEWQNFQQGISTTEGVTGLGQLPAFKTAFGLELEAKGISSVEELAARSEPEEDYLKKLWQQARVYIQLQDAENESGKEVQAVS